MAIAEDNPYKGDSTSFSGTSYNEQMDVLQDPWPEIRVALASSVHCELGVLEELACDREKWVRIAVAQNPIVTEEILDMLCADEDEEVALVALGFAQPDVPEPASGITIVLETGNTIHIPPHGVEGQKVEIQNFGTVTYTNGSWYFGGSEPVLSEPDSPKELSLWRTVQKAAVAAVAERAGAPLLQALVDPDQLVARATEKSLQGSFKS